MDYNYVEDMQKDALALAKNLSGLFGKIEGFKKTLTPDQLREIDKIENSGEAMKQAKKNLSDTFNDLSKWGL